MTTTRWLPRIVIGLLVVVVALLLILGLYGMNFSS